MRIRLATLLRNTRRKYSTQSNIQEWISKTIALTPTEHTDTIDPLRAAHLIRTLPTRQHLPPPSVKNGDELGKGHSMIYFQPETMLKDLGRDGSSTEYNAPHPYTRRMWAGGSFAWSSRTGGNRILRIGQEVVERRTIDTVQYKPKGDMIFINQSRKIWNKGLEGVDDMWGVKEVRTHVFRPPSAPPTPSISNDASTSATTIIDKDSDTTRPSTTTPTPITTPITTSNTQRTNPDITFTYTPTSPLLFRYSALTFNAHKIHYDHPHTLSHENQPTLLVHGPLTATLLIELAVGAGKERGKELVGFDYRAVGPIFVDSECVLSGWWEGEGLVLEAKQGERIGMKASATFA